MTGKEKWRGEKEKVGRETEGGGEKKEEEEEEEKQNVQGGKGERWKFLGDILICFSCF